MGRIRRVLAFPLYFLAFVFHLLTALFTVSAQKIAGDESGPLHRSETISLVAIAVIVIAAVPAWVSANPPAVDEYLLTAHAPIGFRIDPSFAPEQMASSIPLIRIWACILSQNAVRHALQPAPVEFAPCNNNDRIIQTTLAENLIDMTVSGVATVGKARRNFTVTLQHNPPTVNGQGFNITAIQIDSSGISVPDVTN
jgi:hypothetical protein